MKNQNQSPVFIDNEAVYEMESKFHPKLFWVIVWAFQILIIAIGLYLVSKVY